ncbi:hypothetical protein CRG98_036319 [Punica granatum]|uniref:Uncharacterized protein n=1 Tax=Punica granatum TaxID=22663 RepID=A0A2I0IH06_PUNGR|nr:hypothetical protein CRG98_036319 [Punica granatum]
MPLPTRLASARFVVHHCYRDRKAGTLLYLPVAFVSCWPSLFFPPLPLFSLLLDGRKLWEAVDATPTGHGGGSFASSQLSPHSDLRQRLCSKKSRRLQQHSSSSSSFMAMRRGIFSMEQSQVPRRVSPSPSPRRFEAEKESAVDSESSATVVEDSPTLPGFNSLTTFTGLNRTKKLGALI